MTNAEYIATELALHFCFNFTKKDKTILSATVFISRRIMTLIFKLQMQGTT